MPIQVTPMDAMDARAAAALASELLLAEYIHRSANDFAVACAEVHVAGREASLERTRVRLGTVLQRLHALASIQRLLLPPRHPVMDLGAQIATLCQLHTEARFAGQGVFVDLRADDVLVNAQRGWALLMIVSELLTNAARHAFGGKGGLVTVEIARCGDEIVCRLGDDGVGMPPERTEARAGTAIIAELARSAGIQLAHGPSLGGATFELRMPAATSH